MPASLFIYKGGIMKKVKNTEDQLTSSERIAMKTEGFFAKHAKLLAITGIVVILIVVIALVATMIVNNNAEKDFTAVAQLEEAYNNLLVLDSASDEYKSASEAFLADADALISKKGNSYPVLKANYLKGLYYVELENWADAQSAFEAVATEAGTTYLASLSYMNAAACAENNGDQSKALEYYNRVGDFGVDVPEAPKALFNVARIYEEQGDTELAKATFQQLIDQFAVSEYAKMASARIVTL